jgi:hypothetical protein
MTKAAYLIASDAASDAVLPPARRCSCALPKHFALLLCIAERVVKRFSKPLAAFKSPRSGALGRGDYLFILRGGETYRQRTGHDA